MSGGPLTVGQLEARLRSLLPRLGKRDRQFVLDGIEAIHELATRLHIVGQGKRPAKGQTSQFELKQVHEDLMRDTVDAQGLKP